MRAATELAQEIADSCAELLGDRLVAVILHGSLVLGDYSPASSDVDLLAIVERPLTDDELATVAELVLARRGKAAGIDLRVVTRAVAGEPTESPAVERWQQLTDDAEHAALMVLTACRIWKFAVEGVHCSKTEAARWALLQEPALPAVEAALRRRIGDTNVQIAPADIAALLARVRGELARRYPAM